MRFIWPLTQAISRDFYYKSSIYIGGQHMAVDIPAAWGTPIRAVAEGLVTEVGYSSINGYYVEVAHNYGWITKYRHFMEPAPVAEGDVVLQGQSIGNVGSTGWSSGPHLHFDLWNSSKQSPEAVYKAGIWAHDPEIYLGKEEEAMTDEEFAKLVRTVRITALDDQGKPTSAARTLAQWMEVVHLHTIDKAKHSGTGGLKRGDKVTLE
ncbi:hypothetical protein LCGC14_1084920 [marine sediment metagenome]|uniref:M23ase beta-sheet core domain-containing protein n=1 Tax=marine sediment metagenome TaxID=412755 RepID=A0A0F9PX97_9ZZZZ